MGFVSWRRWLNRVARSLKPSPATARKRSTRLNLEALESRLAPATDVWTGLGGTNLNWSNGANWSTGSQPNPGDDLVFPVLSPTLSSALTNTNDLPAGTVFNSITISASNYKLSGNQITLGLGNTVNGSGNIIVNSSSLNDVLAFQGIQLGGNTSNNQFVTVNAGSSLNLNSPLSVSGQLNGTVTLTKEGVGTLLLSQDNSSFPGNVTIAQGVLQITQNNALGNPAVGVTTVQQNAQLQLITLTNPVLENLVLDGPGINNDGALLSVSGNNTWAGTITLDSDADLGVTAGVLNVSGQVSDLGSGHNLSKEGAGQLIFSHVGGNTYRGLTTIDNGILTITDPMALGLGGSTASGTVVNKTLTGTGTLQLKDPSGIGFTVQNEFLVLNGGGVNGIGALDNAGGNNTWAGPVTLGSPSPNGSNVSIGSEANAGALLNLTISGVISDRDPNLPGDTPLTLTKVGAGRVTLTNSNTYLGQTFVAQGALNVEDSQALGPKTKNAFTFVENGAALELQVDNIPDSVVSGSTTQMVFTDPLLLAGTGLQDGLKGAATGALRSISGINTWAGSITLLGAANDAIGVDPDTRPGHPTADNTYFTNDYSLTVTGNIGDPANQNPVTTFTKVGAGQLILPNANTLVDPVDIQQGWVTIENNQSLGARLIQLNGVGQGDTVQPPTTVENGAALHLKALVGSLNVPNNLILSGTGITTAFGLISQEGALMNLDGLNTVSGIIKLNGTAGIGVQQVDISPAVSSELTLTGAITNFGNTVGGLTKLGGQRLYIQGPGTYTGQTDIKEGVVRLQNNTGLGTDPTGNVTQTIVEAGAALELGQEVASLNGGISAGIQVSGEQLILNGSGNTSAIPNTPGVAIAPLTVLVNDNLWNGPVTLDTYATAFTVNFQGGNNNLPPMTADASLLTGTNPNIVISTPGGANSAAQTITFGGTITGGTFTLTFSDGTTSQTTAPILWTTNATALAVAIQAALDALPNVGNNNPLVTAASATIDTEANTRLTIAGTIDDAANKAAGGSDINKVGTGELALSGANTYRGVTYVSQGIVIVNNSQALGSTVGGTVVANGASLELQGNITVAGEPLTVQGQGVAAVPNVPVQWFQDGPAPLTNGQTPGNQNTTGRVTGVTTDPSDPNVIYISTADGGAWKTIDGGVTWQPLFDAQLGSTDFSGAIAVAPWDPRVVFLGTGEANNGANSFYGTGVYMSTDSGRTWKLVTDPSNPIAGKAVSKIVVDPNGSLANFNIYVAVSDTQVANGQNGSGAGVYRYNPLSGWFNMTAFTSVARQTQKGKQNAPPNTPGPDDDFRISFPQTNATWSDVWLDRYGVLFAALGTATGGASNGVFRTESPTTASANNPPVWYVGDGDQPGVGVDDESSTEFPTLAGGAAENGNIKITVVDPAAISGPTNSNTVIYAAISTPEIGGQAGLLGIWVSTNGGVSWAATTNQPPDYLTTQGWNDSTIVAADPNTVYVAGDTGIFMTPDGGTTWNSLSPDPLGNGPRQNFYASTLNASGQLVVGTAGGVWQLNPANNNWTDVNGNLAITQFNGIAVGPSNPNSALGGAVQNGLDLFNGSSSWGLAFDSTATNDATVSGGQVAINPNNPSIMYGVTDGGLYQSVNAGQTWTPINSLATGSNYFPLVLDSINTSRLLAGGAFGLQESTTQGANWVRLNVPTPLAITAIGIATYQGTVALDPTARQGFPPNTFIADPAFSQVTNKLANTYDPDTIYVVANNSQIWVTKNHGVSWVNRTGTVPGSSIAQIVVDPSNRDTVYVVRNVFGGQQVWRSTDSGQTWTDVTKNLPNSPVWSIVIDPRNGYIYVGNDLGVYLCTNIAATNPSWSRFGAGLPLVQVRSLALNQSLDTLTAGTYGRSTYTLYLDNSQTGIGALTNLAGSAVWAGPVNLVGDSTHPVTLGAAGTQALANGIAAANLNIVGPVGDLTPGLSPRLIKVGSGTLTLSGSNTYAGVTEVQQGILIANNPMALGAVATSEVQSVSLVNLGGTFTLTFNGQITGTLNASSTTLAADIQTALNGLSTISGVGGSVTVTETGNNIYSIAFGGSLADIGLPLLTAAATGGTSATVTRILAGGQYAGTVVDQNMALELESSVANEPLTLNGDGIAFNGHNTGALRNISNANTYSGPITLSTQTSTTGVTIGVDSGSQLTITGPISDGAQQFNLVKELPGTLVLSPVHTFSVTFQGSLMGTFQPTMTANGANLTGTNPSVSVATTTVGGPVNAVQTITFGGTITGGTFTLTFNGMTTTAIPWSTDAPTLAGNIQSALNALLGANNTQVASVANGNSYKGTTFVFQGKLEATDPRSLGIPGGPPSNGTVVMDGAQLQLQGGVTISGETVSLSGSGINGTGALLSLGNGTTPVNNTWNGPINLTATPAFSPTDFPTNAVSIGVANAIDTLTVGGPVGELAASNIASFGLTKVGPGKLVLQQADSYSGVTTVATGILSVQNSQALGTPGGPASTPPNGTVVNAGATLQLDTNPTGVTNPPPVTFTNEILTLNGNGVGGIGALENLSGNNVWTASSAPPASVNLASSSAVGVDGGSLTISGDIAGGAAANLTKVGTGTLFLPTNNDYLGLTLVQNGIVNVASPLALGAPDTAAVQTVTVNGSAGQFTLTFNGQTTAPLNYNASAAQVQAALNALPSIGGGIGGTVGVTLGGTSEVQTVTVNGSSGTFKLTFNGQTTTALAVNSTATQVQNALNALSSIGGVGGSVAVTLSGNVYTVTFGGSLGVFQQPQMTTSTTGNLSAVVNVLVNGNAIYTVTFQGTLAGFNQPQLVASSTGGATASVANVTNGTGGTIVSNNNEVQAVTVNGVSGTFTLTFNGQTTAALPYNAPATGPGSVQSALMALSSIPPGGTVNVTFASGTYTVTFGGSLAGQNLPQMTAAATGGDVVTVATVTDGGTGTVQLKNNITVSNETLQLVGNGFNGIGALDSLSGNNSWDGAVLLNGNTSIGSEGGSTLTIDKTIGESAAGTNLTKIGFGTVTFSGSTSNTYTGLTSVNDGTLQLNKTGALAVQGNLTVGDGTANSPLSDIVLLQQNNQINPAANVVINSDGLLDLGNQTQTIATLNMTGGTVRLTGANSALTLTGNVTATSDSLGLPATVSGSGTLILTGANPTFTVSGTNSPDMLVSAVIGGSNGLTKLGNGTLDLTGVNTYTGTTTATAGTLLVDGPNGTIGPVALNGGTLGGTGTVGAISATAAGGTLSPGDGAVPGTLNVTGDVILNPAVFYNAVLDGPNQGVDYSVLNVTGNVALSGARLEGTVGNSYTPNVGDAFVIIEATGAVSGNFAQGSSIFISGLKFSIADLPALNPDTVVLTRVLPNTTTTVATSALNNTAIYGQPVTFTATVTPEPGATLVPQGTVTFFVDGTRQFPDSVLNNLGQATFTISNLSVAGSPHTITATYNGDPSNYNGSSGSLAGGQKITKASTTTQVTSNVNPSVFGQTVTFTATILPQFSQVPGGTVDFSIDGTTVASGLNLANGQATFSTSALSVSGSPHTVTVSFHDADGNFTNSTGNLVGGQNVNKDNTTITVATSAASAPYGQPKITAKVTPNAPGNGQPTGQVTFVINNGTTSTQETDSLVNGTATLQELLPVQAGSYTITATYAGDGSFNPNATSNSISQTITTATSSVTVTTSATNNTSVYGKQVTFTATVNPEFAGVPGGTVDFIIDGSTAASGVVLVNGVATYSTTTLTVNGSPHSVTVNFNDTDGNFTNSSGFLSPGQSITKASTSVTVTADHDPSVFGQQVTFTATVNPQFSGTPGGTVDFKIDGSAVATGVTLTNGKATYSTSTLSVGGSPHVVTVTFNDTDGNFTGSTGSLLGGQNVNQDGATVSVTSSSTNNTSTYGNTVTFTATVAAAAPGAGTPTGTVTFMDVTNPATPVTLGSGTLNKLNPDVATYTTSSLQLTGGTHTITAVYQGDGNFALSTSPGLTQTVNKAASALSNVTSDNAAPVVTQPIHFSATVSAGPGLGTPTGTVNFYDNGALIGTGNVDPATGIATATVTSLHFGSHPITAQYSGDTNFAVSNSQGTFTQQVDQASTTTTLATTNANAVYGEAVITATVAAQSPGTGVGTGTVNFTVTPAGGSPVTYANVALVNGTATLPATLNVGSYSITASYAGNADFAASSTAQALSQTVNPATSKVSVASSPGSPVFGQSVKFTATVTAVSPGAGTPAGTVDFVIDGTVVDAGVALTNGSASYSTSALDAAHSPHSVTVNFHDTDGNFTDGSGSLAGGQVIGKASTSTAVTSSTSSPTFGQPVTFTATVATNGPGAGTPVGTVVFSIDNGAITSTQPLVNGQAQFTISTLNAGGHAVSATYSGSGNFSTSTGSLAGGLTVSKTATTTTVTSDQPTVAVAGRIVNIVATVTSSTGAVPGGTVTFILDGTPALQAPMDGQGRALFATVLGSGQHTIVAVYNPNGNFTGSSSTTFTQVVESANELFVAQVYRDLLNREAGPQELAAWGNPLDAGLITRTNVAQGITGSLEYKIDTVDALYVKYLHRHADPGSAGFVNFLLNGGTDEQVASLLAGSDEYFFNRGGGTVDGFLNALFEDGLGRPVDPTGEAAFTQALAFNVSRQQVAFTVLASFEHDLNFVAGIYQKLLHRTPDTAGQVGWANLMQNGVTDELIIDSIVGSDEYYFDL